MNRRELIRLFGGSALVWPALARAQYDKRPVKIGLVPLGSPGNTYDRSLVEAFRQGLRQVGLVENRDIVLDIAWTTGNPDQDRACSDSQCSLCCGLSVVALMLICETVICDMFTNASTP